MQVQISNLMTRFDADGTSKLDFPEFYKLAKYQLGLNKKVSAFITENCRSSG